MHQLKKIYIFLNLLNLNFFFNISLIFQHDFFFIFFFFSSYYLYIFYYFINIIYLIYFIITITCFINIYSYYFSRIIIIRNFYIYLFFFVYSIVYFIFFIFFLIPVTKISFTYNVSKHINLLLLLYFPQRDICQFCIF